MLPEEMYDLRAVRSTAGECWTGSKDRARSLQGGWAELSEFQEVMLWAETLPLSNFPEHQNTDHPGYLESTLERQVTFLQNLQL